MASFDDIWEALREDVDTDTLLEMVTLASEDEFDKYQPLDGVSYLVEAAMVFRCDAAVFRALCERTSSSHKMKKAWHAQVHLRAPKEFCVHLAHCYSNKGLETAEERIDWIERCMRGERRTWFWKEVVAAQIALVQDKSSLQKYFADWIHEMPAGVSAYLRTALGLPDDYE